MPIHEYVCSRCGDRTQRLQEPGQDSTGSRCLNCGDGELSRVVSGFGAGVAYLNARFEEGGASGHYT